MSQKEQADDFLRQLEEFVEMMKSSTGLPIVIDQKTGSSLWYDQREIRLRYIISVEKTKKFFQALSEGKILATKCVNSGRIYFPPQVDCPEDPTSEVEWVELPREGKLLTWTMINVKPYSFSHYGDYIVGIAELDEGLNVLAWVREKDPRNLRVGQRVKLEIVKREPEGYLTYELVPEG